MGEFNFGNILNQIFSKPQQPPEETPIDNSNPQVPVYEDEDGTKYTKLRLFESIISIYEGSLGGGSGMIPSGPTPFKNMSRAEKMKVCGITSNTMTPQEVQAAGLLTTVTLNQTKGKYSGQVNKAVADDLANICNEICSLGFFNMSISNTFRPTDSVKSANTVSKHCWGVAIDINPTNGCPWFNTHIQRSFTEPPQGTPPPWSFRAFKCGPYNRSTCIWSYDHPVVKIFENHGWGWGGAYGDTMHFSLFDGH